MTGNGLPARAGRLRAAQAAFAARVVLLAALLAQALVIGSVSSTPFAGTAGALGSVALVVALWAVLASVVLRALLLDGPAGAALPRAWLSASRGIRRAEEPGRPGRVRPRAPGAGPAPRLAS